MTIREVSEKYHISQDTLRYYERVGLIPAVHRTAGGVRDYQESDLDWVEHAICMRSAGVSVEALIEYVRLYQQGMLPSRPVCTCCRSRSSCCRRSISGSEPP